VLERLNTFMFQCLNASQHLAPHASHLTPPRLAPHQRQPRSHRPPAPRRDTLRRTLLRRLRASRPISDSHVPIARPRPGGTRYGAPCFVASAPRAPSATATFPSPARAPEGHATATAHPLCALHFVAPLRCLISIQRSNCHPEFCGTDRHGSPSAVASQPHTSRQQPAHRQSGQYG